MKKEKKNLGLKNGSILIKDRPRSTSETFEKTLSDVIGNVVGDQKFPPFPFTTTSCQQSLPQAHCHLPTVELAVLEVTTGLREESTLSRTVLRACIHSRSPSE